MTESPDWKARAEQAQQALAKASQKNTDLLERLSGVRVGLAALMRRSYPAHVSGVEKALGGHLSDLPDSVLLGYLEAFSLMSTTGRVTTPNDLHEISRALRDSGFPMPGDATALDMAVAIRGGFQAARYDNDRLRKNSRGGKNGPKNSGAHAIHRDLSWAEPQDGDGNKITDEDATKPRQKNSQPEPAAAQKNAEGRGRSNRSRGQQAKINFNGPQQNPNPPAPQSAEEKRKLARFESLEAGLIQPAPRFMRDVVAELGSTDLATEWQERQKGVGNWAFIPPQSKHRQRGALLVPQENIQNRLANFSTSPWGRALAQKYKAGRLYDIAVILSKLSDTIFACGFSRHCMELTYRQDDELRAIIIGLEAGADPWADVEESVGRFLADGAGVQDILVIPCPARSEDTVVATLKSAAAERGWHMQAPVRVQALETWVSEDGRGAEIVPGA